MEGMQAFERGAITYVVIFLTLVDANTKFQILGPLPLVSKL